MPLFAKPQFNSVWATTGVKLTPDVSKISQGWVVEIPPYEYDNWIQNRQDALLAHLNQLGIPMWDSTVEYQAGKSYVQGVTSGVVYCAVTTNTNVNPELDIQGNWVVAFQASGQALLKSQNLADVPDKAAARDNLGIATTAFYDSRYLQQVNNLADISNKATARTNLDVYSKVEVLAMFPVAEIKYFATQTAPVGYLVADGSAVSRTTYFRLFAAIGTTFGTGNGSTTFNLPNLLGEFIRGWDAGRGVDVGRLFGSGQLSQNLSHNHTTYDPGHSHQLVTNGVSADRVGPAEGALHQGSGKVSSGTTVNATGLVVNSSGGNESRPRNVAMLPCISVGLI